LNTLDGQILYQNGIFQIQFEKALLSRVPRVENETPVVYIPKVIISGDFKWYAKKDQFDHYFLLRKPYFNKMNRKIEDFISEKLELDIRVNLC